MTRELTYMAGFAALTAGLVLGAYLLGVPPEWLAVIVLVMAGLTVIRLARTSKTPAPKPKPEGWFPEDRTPVDSMPPEEEPRPRRG